MQEQIEGVPVGTKVARIGAVKEGETFIDVSGLVKKALGHGYCKGTVVLEPDNVYGVIDLDSIQIKAGHRRVSGDSFRTPSDNELFVGVTRDIAIKLPGSDSLFTKDQRRIIVELIQPDNAYGVFEIDSIPTPVGHRRVGFREPLDNERYINACTHLLNSQPYKSLFGFGTVDKRRIIVEPIPNKRRVLFVEYELKHGFDVLSVMASYKNTSHCSYPSFRVEEYEA